MHQRRQAPTRRVQAMLGNCVIGNRHHPLLQAVTANRSWASDSTVSRALAKRRHAAWPNPW